jgi:hypothetical protein
MPKRFPVAPAHPERNCWGCDHYCAAADMRCGNGSVRTAHPIELFGEDWLRGEAGLAADWTEPGQEHGTSTPAA